MKLVMSLLGFTLAFSSAHADSVYTCVNSKGDSVIITLTQEGQKMTLRSLYARLKLTQGKRRPKNPALKDYVNFGGSYPNGYAVIPVHENLLKDNSQSTDIVGSLMLEEEEFGCRTGEGKLTVSRATRREFSTGGGNRREPCKLTSYYGGMTFMPPRIICNYGGMTVIHGGGRLF